jgi:hypothetical protein
MSTSKGDSIPHAVLEVRMGLVAVFENGLEKAKKNVELFKKLVKSAQAKWIHEEVAVLNIALDRHKAEVEMYKKLIADARRRESNASNRSGKV